MRESDKILKLAGVERNIESLSPIEIINQFDYLKKAFKYLIVNNLTNRNPYHNLNHLLTVLKYCYQGAMEEEISDEQELKELLIVSIFHDTNHSAGKETDEVNIKEAWKFIEKFLDSENIEANREAMEEILRATEYPYVIDEKDLNLRQKIMRDADIMQVYEDDWIHQNVGGLSNELNIEFLNFIKSQRKFLESAEFNTNWGKNKKEENWDEVMRQFEFLEEACEIKLK